MPTFDPNIPRDFTDAVAGEMRDQFTSLKDLIDAVPAPRPETDPVFAASEAAKFVDGDKAKLDAALTVDSDAFTDTVDARINSHNTGSYPLVASDVATPMLHKDGSGAIEVSSDFDMGGQALYGLPDPAGDNHADTQGARNAALAAALTYTPANAGQWAGAPPATLAAAIDRLAAVVSNNGANPIP